MNNKSFSWKTIAYIFWPLLILGGLVVFRFTYSGANTGEGAGLYQVHCANCHGNKGEGFKQLYPPLAGAALAKGDPTVLACLIKNGANTPLSIGDTTYTQPMPGNPALSVVQITAIVNYVRGSWGNDAPPIRATVVENAIKSCP